jgi:hypothetical protein
MEHVPSGANLHFTLLSKCLKQNALSSKLLKKQISIFIDFNKLIRDTKITFGICIKSLTQ